MTAKSLFVVVDNYVVWFSYVHNDEPIVYKGLTIQGKEDLTVDDVYKVESDEIWGYTVEKITRWLVPPNIMKSIESQCLERGRQILNKCIENGLKKTEQNIVD